VATATGEDTFFRHLQHNDANYALRLEEWTFGKEKADAPGPRLSGLTAGGVAALLSGLERTRYGGVMWWGGSTSRGWLYNVRLVLVASFCF
jgi:hypothetical protein